MTLTITIDTSIRPAKLARALAPAIEVADQQARPLTAHALRAIGKALLEIDDAQQAELRQWLEAGANDSL